MAESNSNLIATEQDVRECFRILFDRDVAAAEWPGHSWRVGQPLAEVVEGYLRSSEFLDRRAGFLNSASEIGVIPLPEHRLLAFDKGDKDVGNMINQSRGNYELHLKKEMIKLFGDKTNFLDIGANIGFFSITSSAYIKHGNIYAVEPNPRNVQCLLKSVQINDIRNIKIFPIAASDSFGALRLNTTYSNGSTIPIEMNATDVMSSTIVASARLDQVLDGASVNVIKIDVEGAEYLALKGGESIIRRNKPVIFCELTPNALEGVSQISARDFLNFIFRIGYKCRVIYKSQPTGNATTSVDQILEAVDAEGRGFCDVMFVPD